MEKIRKERKITVALRFVYFLSLQPLISFGRWCKDSDRRRQKPTQENLFPRLVVFCLLLSSLSFTPTKRYEEVDGVRKEKERLTTDHQPQHHIFLLLGSYDVVVGRWLTFRHLFLSTLTPSTTHLLFLYRQHLHYAALFPSSQDIKRKGQRKKGRMKV